MHEYHTRSLNCLFSVICSGQPSLHQHLTLHTPQPPGTATMRSFLGSLAVLTAATSASATLTAYDIAAQLEQLAFQTYAAKPIVQAFTQSNVRPTLIGQGPVVVSKESMQDTQGSQLCRSQILSWTRWSPPSWPMLPQWSSQQHIPTKPQSSQLPKAFRMYVAWCNSPFVHANDPPQFVQGSLELCDAYTAAAATVESTDAYTSAKISDAITRLGTATDVSLTCLACCDMSRS